MARALREYGPPTAAGHRWDLAALSKAWATERAAAAVAATANKAAAVEAVAVTAAAAATAAAVDEAPAPSTQDDNRGSSAIDDCCCAPAPSAACDMTPAPLLLPTASEVTGSPCKRARANPTRSRRDKRRQAR